MISLKLTKNNLKTCMWTTSKAVAITVFLICFTSKGCSLIKLKKDTNRLPGATVITGHIDARFLGNGPIIVAAYSVEDGMKIANYTVLHDSGEYKLGVYQGHYYIFAYRDKNSNLIYDDGEPAGQYGDPTLVQVPAVGVVFDINIVIPEKGQNIEIPYGKRISPVKPQKLYSRQAGIITDLNDERFAQENGIKGFWEPSSFFDQFGGTIYFLEEYDPDKIPVLFIHGATGTPKGWQYFVDDLDRSRFQPWFFYYPTGLRIDSMAYLLLWKLSNLQAKYQFSKIYFTAHSMGGLVARSFIVNYFSQFPYVKLFVSLATPWGSDRMAEYGVKQSPAVINSFYEKDSTSLPHSGGYLKIHFSYDYDYKGVKPRLALILHRIGKKDEETVTFFNNSDNGNIVGPFPAGEYVASMVTMAAKTTKKNIPVSIEGNKTKELKFVFKPDGVIRGCVAVALQPEDKFVGRPDNRYRSIDADIHIQSITLKGNGIHRTLKPIRGPEINDFTPYILRNDGCYNNCFGFFGLPAGDYNLFIKAEGYESIEKKYRVMPGIPQYFRVTELTPD